MRDPCPPHRHLISVSEVGGLTHQESGEEGFGRLASVELLKNSIPDCIPGSDQWSRASVERVDIADVDDPRVEMSTGAPGARLPSPPDPQHLRPRDVSLRRESEKEVGTSPGGFSAAIGHGDGPTDEPAATKGARLGIGNRHHRQRPEFAWQSGGKNRLFATHRHLAGDPSRHENEGNQDHRSSTGSSEQQRHAGSRGRHHEQHPRPPGGADSPGE